MEEVSGASSIFFLLYTRARITYVSRNVELTASLVQKKKNTQSGTEFQRTKEAQAAIMRQKQEAGEC